MKPRSHIATVVLPAALAFLGACRHGTEHLAPSETPNPSGAASVAARDAARPSNTTVRSWDQLLRISGSTSQARHRHGGPPAQLGTARFEVQNQSDKPRLASVSSVTFVRTHPCGDKPVETTTQLQAAGIAVEQPGGADELTQPTITIAPRLSATLLVTFPLVEAYQVYCDFFSFRVTFLLDSQEPLIVTATTEVTRVTLRKQDAQLPGGYDGAGFNDGSYGGCTRSKCKSGITIDQHKQRPPGTGKASLGDAPWDERCLCPMQLARGLLGCSCQQT